MTQPGFDANGKPEWQPNVSLQWVTARDKAKKAPKGPERDQLVDKWLDAARTDLAISISGYRDSLHQRTKITRMLRKKDREAAAYWLPYLGTVDAVNAWWHQRLMEMADELRTQD